MGSLFQSIMGMFGKGSGANGAAGGSTMQMRPGSAQNGWPTKAEQSQGGGGMADSIRGMFGGTKGDNNAGMNADDELHSMMAQQPQQNTMFQQMMAQSMQQQPQQQHQPIRPAAVPTVQPVQNSNVDLGSLFKLLSGGR